MSPVSGVHFSLRRKGIKAGMLRLRCFRPFPGELLKHHLKRMRNLVVIDRDLSYGNEGAVCSEVRGALYGSKHVPAIVNFIAGLGGADLMPREVETVAQEAVLSTGSEERRTVFQFMEKAL